MPIIDPTVAPSTRQEAFCRHYAVSGNAADAARQAGYSGRSARQTGCALLRPRRIYGPWSPEEVEQHRWSRLEREEEALRPAVRKGTRTGSTAWNSNPPMTSHDIS